MWITASEPLYPAIKNNRRRSNYSIHLCLHSIGIWCVGGRKLVIEAGEKRVLWRREAMSGGQRKLASCQGGTKQRNTGAKGVKQHCQFTSDIPCSTPPTACRRRIWVPYDQQDSSAWCYRGWNHWSIIRVEQDGGLRAIACDTTQNWQFIKCQLSFKGSEGKGNWYCSCWRYDSLHIFIVSVIQPAHGSRSTEPNRWRSVCADRYWSAVGRCRCKTQKRINAT